MAYNDNTEYGTNGGDYATTIHWVEVETSDSPIKVGDISFGCGLSGTLGFYQSDGVTLYFTMRGKVNYQYDVPPLLYPHGLRLMAVGAGYFDVLYTLPRR